MWLGFILERQGIEVFDYLSAHVFCRAFHSLAFGALYFEHGEFPLPLVLTSVFSWPESPHKILCSLRKVFSEDVVDYVH